MAFERDESKIVVFDFGGVIEKHAKGDPSVYDYKSVFSDALMYACGLTASWNNPYSDVAEYHLERFCNDKINNKVQLGFVTDAELIHAMGAYICKEIGEPFDMADDYGTKWFHYVREHLRYIQSNPGMVRCIEHALNKCKAGIMSNLGLVWAPSIYAKVGHLKLDYIWESYKEGFMKPDPKAYESFEKRCGISGKNVLFFDDSPENIEAAKEFGWNAILYDKRMEGRLFVNHLIDQFMDGRM